jgi:hypothetical protein
MDYRRERDLMIRSAKQRRFLEATEAQRGYTGGAAGRASVTPSVGSAPAPSVAPLTMPGGAVQSGGYMAGAQFKMPSLLPMRKVRR